MGRTEQDENVLLDALRELNGWVADDNRLSRSLPLDDSQHAELAEQIIKQHVEKLAASRRS